MPSLCARAGFLALPLLSSASAFFSNEHLSEKMPFLDSVLGFDGWTPPWVCVVLHAQSKTFGEKICGTHGPITSAFASDLMKAYKVTNFDLTPSHFNGPNGVGNKWYTWKDQLRAFAGWCQFNTSWYVAVLVVLAMDCWIYLVGASQSAHLCGGLFWCLCACGTSARHAFRWLRTQHASGPRKQLAAPDPVHEIFYRNGKRMFRDHPDIEAFEVTPLKIKGGGNQTSVTYGPVHAKTIASGAGIECQQPGSDRVKALTVTPGGMIWVSMSPQDFKAKRFTNVKLHAAVAKFKTSKGPVLIANAHTLLSLPDDWMESGNVDFYHLGVIGKDGSLSYVPFKTMLAGKKLEQVVNFGQKPIIPWTLSDLFAIEFPNWAQAPGKAIDIRARAQKSSKGYMYVVRGGEVYVADGEVRHSTTIVKKTGLVFHGISSEFGDSGSPIFDSAGRLLGIQLGFLYGRNVAISTSGINRRFIELGLTVRADVKRIDSYLAQYLDPDLGTKTGLEYKDDLEEEITPDWRDYEDEEESDDEDIEEQLADTSKAGHRGRNTLDKASTIQYDHDNREIRTEKDRIAMVLHYQDRARYGSTAEAEADRNRAATLTRLDGEMTVQSQSAAVCRTFRSALSWADLSELPDSDMGHWENAPAASGVESIEFVAPGPKPEETTESAEVRSKLLAQFRARRRTRGLHCSHFSGPGKIVGTSSRHIVEHFPTDWTGVQRYYTPSWFPPLLRKGDTRPLQIDGKWTFYPGTDPFQGMTLDVKEREKALHSLGYFVHYGDPCLSQQSTFVIDHHDISERYECSGFHSSSPPPGGLGWRPALSRTHNGPHKFTPVMTSKGPVLVPRRGGRPPTPPIPLEKVLEEKMPFSYSSLVSAFESSFEDVPEPVEVKPSGRKIKQHDSFHSYVSAMTHVDERQWNVFSDKVKQSDCDDPDGDVDEAEVARILHEGAHDVTALRQLRKVSGRNKLLHSKPFALLKKYVATPNYVEGGTDVLSSDGTTTLLRAAGKIDMCVAGGKKPTPASDALCAKIAEEVGIDLTGWVMPPSAKDVKGILTSMKVQLGKRLENTRRAAEMTFVEDEEALDEAFDSWPANDTKMYDGEVCEALADLLASVDGTKSSGFSQLIMPGTKQVWKDDPTQTVLLAFLRLALIHAYTRFELVQLDPRVLVERGLCDPRTPFIKGEPHKIKKAREGRWRLIWPISILDELVYSYCHRAQNKIDIEKYQSGKLTGPVFPCIGIGHDDAGLRTFKKYADRARGDAEGCESDDVSGFDFSITLRMWVMDAYGRADCFVRGQPTDEAFEEKCNWYEDYAINVALLSGAHEVLIGKELFVVCFPGVMPSAHPSTGGSNTRMKLCTQYIVHRKPAVATGDDGMKRGRLSDDAKNGLIAQGIDIRDLSYREDGVIEFNSLLISEQDGRIKSEFLNFEKLIVNLLYSHGVYDPNCPSGSDAVSSGYFNLRHSPEKKAKLRQVAIALGYPEALGVLEVNSNIEDEL